MTEAPSVSLSSQTIVIIGGGVMGSALCQGLLDSGLSIPQRITVVEPEVRKRAALWETMGVSCSADGREALPQADLIVLAIKPQVFATVAEQLRAHMRAGVLVISIMAGIPTSLIADALAHNLIVRAMPNTAAKVRQSTTVWYAAPIVPEPLRATAAAVLSSIGIAIEVQNEAILDGATAVSGSGPAYVCLLAEALVEGAVAIGLSRDLALCLVTNTLAGTAALLAQSGAHPALVRESVTSPAGTTAAGLLALEARAFRAACVEAVRAAYARAKELGSAK
ncbi:MAG: pyrroline-5-carboxylate reductase [Anaerolineae bacterium]